MFGFGYFQEQILLEAILDKFLKLYMNSILQVFPELGNVRISLPIYGIYRVIFRKYNNFVI